MTYLTVTAADGHAFQAYEARPAGPSKGGLVILQEIFGVNAHIRSIADTYAAAGYHCIAPALFDRFERGFESGYTPDDMPRAREALGKSNIENALADTQACIDTLAEAGVGKVGVLGFCYGGLLSWLSATRLTGVDAAVVYYAGRIGMFAEEAPRCPVIAHFGEQDASIPMEDVSKLRDAQTSRDVTVYVYPEGGHGFNCDERPSYNAEASELARARTLDFLATQL